MSTELVISVSPGDGLPIYRQIVDQLKLRMASGDLASGARLPSHRDLARFLVVAPLTVKRAYDTLEADGLVRVERGRGTFVSVAEGTFARAALEERLEALVAMARASGFSEDDVVEGIRRAWRRRTGGTGDDR